MAGMLSLPNELLLSVFHALPTLQTAAHLSGVNRRLYDVWKDKDNEIIHAVLGSYLPAHDEAIALAIVETTQSHTRPAHLSTSLHALAPVLEDNAALATELCKKRYAHFVRWRSATKIRDWECPSFWAEMPAAYYTTRQLVLAYHHPTLRPVLLTILRQKSEETLWAYLYFVTWMAYTMRDDEMRLRHDMNKPEDECDSEDEYEYWNNKPEWDFAYEMIRQAWISVSGGHRT